MALYRNSRPSLSRICIPSLSPAVCRCLFALGVCALSIVHIYMHKYIDMCVVDGQFTIYRYTNSRLPVLGRQPVYSDPWVNRNSLQMLICISVLRTQINKAQRSGWKKTIHVEVINFMSKFLTPGNSWLNLYSLYSIVKISTTNKRKPILGIEYKYPRI